MSDKNIAGKGMPPNVSMVNSENDRYFRSIPLIRPSKEGVEQLFSQVTNFIKNICKAGEVRPSPIMFMYKETDETSCSISGELDQQTLEAYGGVLPENVKFGVAQSFELARKMIEDYKPQAIVIVSFFRSPHKGPIGGVYIHGSSFDKTWSKEMMYEALLDLNPDTGAIEQWILYDMDKEGFNEIDIPVCLHDVLYNGGERTFGTHEEHTI